MTAPLVSCLMVTRDRVALARRAVRCLAAQTWPAVELVVVDDGDADYAPMLAEFEPRLAIRYLRLTPQPGRYLGALRNLALEAARGELCAQWDDDEWYHPDRLRAQVAAQVGPQVVGRGPRGPPQPLAEVRLVPGVVAVEAADEQVAVLGAEHGHRPGRGDVVEGVGEHRDPRAGLGHRPQPQLAGEPIYAAAP